MPRRCCCRPAGLGSAHCRPCGFPANRKEPTGSSILPSSCCCRACQLAPDVLFRCALSCFCSISSRLVLSCPVSVLFVCFQFPCTEQQQTKKKKRKKRTDADTTTTSFLNRRRNKKKQKENDRQYHNNEQGTLLLLIDCNIDWVGLA